MVDLFALLKAALLGIVEGLTEFAPVSSTGHMILVDDLWLRSAEVLTLPVANVFKVVIQLGAILAVVVLFSRRFLDLLGGWPWRHDTQPVTGLRLTHLLVGLVPAGLLGVFLEDYVDAYLFSIPVVIGGLVSGALLMLLADAVSARAPRLQMVEQLTHRQAFVIGLSQCLALWPGFSRSGATISVGVLCGLSHRAAADFTFLMAVPFLLGASAVSLFKNWEHVTLGVLPFFGVGFVSAFVVALLSFHFLLHLIDTVKLTPFAAYRLLLAAAVYLLYL